MNDTTAQDRPQREPKTQSSDGRGQPSQSKPRESTAPGQSGSRFEKFAATQAAGDGVQGDTLKKDKTVDEELGAKMADRK
jgi:hypothetical protein